MTDVYLYLGDCLTFMRDLLDQGIDLLLADPPYGANFDTDYRRFTGGVAKHSHKPRIKGDDSPFDPSPFIGYAPVVVLFGANHFSNKLPKGSWLIWDKRYKNKPLVTSDGEVAWCSKGYGVYIYNHTWDGFLRGPEQGVKRAHPTQKPIALMEWIIQKYTKPGATVFDPFMGSGTTGVACVRTGRHFIGCEIEEAYYQIAQQRIAAAQSQPTLFEKVEEPTP